MDRTYRVVIWLVRAGFRLLGLRFDLRGLEHVPTTGAAVLAANHISYLDFTLVGLAGVERGRLVRFMAKQSTFSNPVSGPLMRRMRHIPVDRSAGVTAARQAARSLAAGELVGVFPESTISRSWTLKPFRGGAAQLARREGVPLLPVVTWGGHRLLTVDGHWHLRRRTPIVVAVGAPVPTAGRTVAAVNEELRDRMSVLLDQVQRSYPDQPRGPEDRWWQPAHLGGTAPMPHEAAELDRLAIEGGLKRVLQQRRDWPAA